MQSTGGKNKKVFVGMSGGVDSSVSSALLKERGFDVTGVFIKVWQPDFLPCNWEVERLDAMRVCALLSIPFRTLDLEKEYKKDVVDYMVSEYKAGRTPNPDVMCNRSIKFSGFLKYALKEGADFVATGHYAENIYSDGKGEHELHRGRDDNKDQSYFLWTLSQKRLEHILFPVGHMEKSEVRKKALEFNLPTAKKKDSQGLCFIGKIDLKEFLVHYIPEKRGNVLDIEGNVVGEHDGAYYLTLGQRHGFNVSAQSPDQDPLYVVRKDIHKNTITVAAKKDIDNYQCKVVELSETHWISKENPKEGKYDVQFRYRQKAFKGKLIYTPNTVSIDFDKAQDGVSEGQSLVVYDGDICLGGGIILKTIGVQASNFR